MATEPGVQAETETEAVTDPQINPPPGGWRPPPRRRATWIMIGAIALAAVLAILYAWNLPPFS